MTKRRINQRHRWAVLALVFVMGCISQKNDMTELDKALAASHDTPEKADAFYGLFLNTDIFIPTHAPAPEGSAEGRSKEGESFAPLVVESDGILFLPVFDRLERLQAWAKGEAIDYVRIPTHALLRSSLEPKLHIVLNVGTPHTKEFVPDELAWLRGTLDQLEPKPFAVPAGTSVVVGPPTNVPEGLVAALTACLLRNQEVEAAYLAQVEFEIPGEKPQLFLVLDVDDAGQQYVETIREDIGIATRGILGEHESLTMQVNNGGGISTGVIAEVDAFYRRSK